MWPSPCTSYPITLIHGAIVSTSTGQAIDTPVKARATARAIVARVLDVVRHRMEPGADGGDRRVDREVRVRPPDTEVAAATQDLAERVREVHPPHADDHRDSREREDRGIQGPAELGGDGADRRRRAQHDLAEGDDRQ